MHSTSTQNPETQAAKQEPAAVSGYADPAEASQRTIFREDSIVYHWRQSSHVGTFTGAAAGSLAGIVFGAAAGEIGMLIGLLSGVVAGAGVGAALDAVGVALTEDS